MNGWADSVIWYRRVVEKEKPSESYLVVTVMFVVLCMRTSKVVRTFPLHQIPL